MSGRASVVVSLALASLALSACGGSYSRAAKPGKSKAADGPRGVEAAALPFEVLDRDGRIVAADDLYAALAGARAVCLGERHRNPHDHWAQLHLFDQVSTRAAADGRAVALGMEMVQRPHQGVLDDYAAGRIDGDALVRRSGWEERWGYDFDLYRPVIEMARDRKGALLALNVSTELRDKIRAMGIDGLGPADRKRVPELDLDNPEHRAWWNAVMASMGGHPHGNRGHGPDLSDEEKKARAEKMYRAQVLWDETMADTASRWLARTDNGVVVILAGNGHCHDSAIVDRIKRRGVARVVSVRPIMDTGEGEVAAAVADRENDFLFVMKLPVARGDRGRRAR